eukprot:TRINITY_DN553_c0_g1_i12.p2 TRINITY_DN553_c0_g1~~TRINITY_DN553_c0_g1_i12.p2  ORF type:complete len:238 (-),score=-18.70 TRINITY_DN553_c0_g1_i12:389-1102(-)
MQCPASIPKASDTTNHIKSKVIMVYLLVNLYGVWVSSSIADNWNNAWRKWESAYYQEPTHSKRTLYHISLPCALLPDEVIAFEQDLFFTPKQRNEHGNSLQFSARDDAGQTRQWSSNDFDGIAAPEGRLPRGIGQRGRGFDLAQLLDDVGSDHGGITAQPDQARNSQRAAHRLQALLTVARAQEHVAGKHGHALACPAPCLSPPCSQTGKPGFVLLPRQVFERTSLLTGLGVNYIPR